MLRRLIGIAVAALVFVAPSAALARGGDDDDRDEVRVSGTCGSGASSKLKVKTDDGGLEVEFEVDANRSGQRWRVSIVQENRVVYRGTRRTGGRSGSFSVERHLRDLAGADAIRARAVGPRGLTCQASATLPG
jgi:hypothetical protein